MRQPLSGSYRIVELIVFADALSATLIAKEDGQGLLSFNLSGDDFDAALALAASEVEIVACTDGEDGAHILSHGQRWHVPATPVQIVDATGAGDLFAGAFLWGLTNGHNLETCGRMGCVAASEVISHIGARPEADLRALFQEQGLI